LAGQRGAKGLQTSGRNLFPFYIERKGAGAGPSSSEAVPWQLGRSQARRQGIDPNKSISGIEIDPDRSHGPRSGLGGLSCEGAGYTEEARNAYPLPRIGADRWKRANRTASLDGMSRRQRVEVGVGTEKKAARVPPQPISDAGACKLPRRFGQPNRNKLAGLSGCALARGKRAELFVGCEVSSALPPPRHGLSSYAPSCETAKKITKTRPQKGQLPLAEETMAAFCRALARRGHLIEARRILKETVTHA
jgi:hypothetical protein